MAHIEPTTFREALWCTAGRKRHLLLGNGFSVSARDQFGYEHLQAAVSNHGDPLDIFKQLGTANFEKAIASLSENLAVAKFECDLEKEDSIREQIRKLKNYLVETVAGVHPGSGFSMTSREYLSCCNFLTPFIGRSIIPRGIVFTTNYDLLLYWVVVKHLAKHSRGQLKFYDGFEGANWKSDRMINENISVVYLHGSLHIFEIGSNIYRVVYQHSPIPRNIISQIRAKVYGGYLPLFVSGGDGDDKIERINKSLYLSAALSRFRFACRETESSLFTVGHSLSEQDKHLMDLIGRGRVRKVFIGAYKGLDSEAGRWAGEMAQRWRKQRSSAFPLEVYVFDSRECAIWTGASENAA
jgi:hypothetical protein